MKSNIFTKDVEILEAMGICERKSFCTKFIDFQDMTWHFIRGVFDGDGSVFTSKVKDKKYDRTYYYTCISFSTASKLFANALCNYLNQNGIVSHINSDSRDREIYYVRINKQESVMKFARKIYQKSDDWKLIRKFEKLCHFL